MESELEGWLSLSNDTFKSRHAQLSVGCRTCLNFDQVSTSPVLDPLAAESFRPCGSAK